MASGSSSSVILALAFAALGACYLGPLEQDPVSATSPTDPSSTAESGSDASAPGAGLPCDVDALLAKRCRSCHVTGGPAPMPLVSYDDLAAPSKSNAAEDVATASIGRLRSATRPMPPPPNERAPSTEILVLEKWVGAGMPRGECGVPASNTGNGGSSSGQPAASVCTSGVVTTDTRKGPNMPPGRACITCHETQEDKPVVWVGGTVYPTIREPDGCYGIAGGATVVITDARGRVINLPVGPTGNFSLDAKTSLPLTMPFRAKVVRNGVERVMATPQSTGNCNGCHTEDGLNGAPGRILAP